MTRCTYFMLKTGRRCLKGLGHMGDHTFKPLPESDDDVPEDAE